MTDYRERQVVAPATLEGAGVMAAGIFDHVLSTRKLGWLPNMFAVMGKSPKALESVASVGEHVRFHSALDEDLREMIICEVSAIRGNKYEWRHHIHKVPERLRLLIGSTAIEDEPAPVGPALRFARLLAAGETVSDELVDSLKETMGEDGLIDLTVMVGYYQLLATFCAVLGVEVEDAMPHVAMPLKGT
jgi:4-carboxymuconolactone decarboxylase